MKQVLFVFIVFLIFLFLITFPIKEEQSIKEEQKEDVRNNVKQEERGIFISYIELQKYLKGKTPTEGKKAIDKMIQSILDLDFNMIILQVRSASDAIYPSSFSHCVG